MSVQLEVIEQQFYEGGSSSMQSVAFSPDGRIIIGAGYGPCGIFRWNLSTGEQLAPLSNCPGSSLAVAISPDGRILAANHNAIIRLWDLITGAETLTLSSHSDIVVSVAFSPDGHTLASGSYDNTIKLWDLKTDNLLNTLRHADAVTAIAFSPDGNTLAGGASGTRDGTIKLWDPGTGTLLHTLSGHVEGISALAFSPDGRTLASGGHDEIVRLWSVDTLQELASMRHNIYSLAGVSGVAFHPSGEVLASINFREEIPVILWDVATGQLIRTLGGHVDEANSIAWSRDGNLLACSSGGRSSGIQVWQVKLSS